MKWPERRQLAKAENMDFGKEPGKKGGKSGDQWAQKQWHGKGKGYNDRGYGDRGGNDDRQPLKRKRY